VLAFILFLKNYKTNLISIKNNNKIKVFILISLFLTCWSLTNKISFGSITLFEIPLNKYILAALSGIKNTGRNFWIVNYFLLFLSIIIIFKSFKEKKAILIIISFFIIQSTDMSPGITKHINLYKHENKNVLLKDKIWDELLSRHKVVKTTYPVSWSGLFGKFSYLMEKYNIEKTNLVIFGRGNRKKIAESRYRLYSDFRNKKLASNTVYIIDNLSHLRHLKYLFKNENVSFFYRDNFWIMTMDEKEHISKSDKNIFNNIRPKILEINEVKNLNFKDKDNYYGFGWSHNLSEGGIWSEGQKSTLLFRTEKSYEALTIEIFCKPYVTEKNEILEFDIYINNFLNKTVKLKNEDKIEILVEKKFMNKNEIKIDFDFKNSISPYEVFESPDSRKLGILAKNIKISPI